MSPLAPLARLHNGVPVLEDREFRTLVRRLAEETGIELADSKRTLVAGRLARRLSALGLGSFRDYVARLQGDAGEVRAFINALTTNQTEFFRDSEQLDWLGGVLPSVLEAARQRGASQIRAWSAACSTGEEPYTVAMLLERATERAGSPFQVLGTDVDTNVLRHAAQARYEAASRSGLPRWAGRFVVDQPDGSFVIAPDLRRRVGFRPLDLVGDPFRFRAPVDVILCRNVFIYFSEQTKRQVAAKLAQHLPIGGLFLVGHAESLRGVPELRHERSNVYVRVDVER